ncbi:MAG TPA: MarP family serine protease, partial [Streptosporangiaceae bacterium]
VLNSRALRAARASVVKIEGVAPSCSRRIEGSGFVYARDHVMTNAHVVAGEKQNQQVFTSSGQLFPARVVLYDPDRDIAVLYVPGLGARPLPFSHPAQTGASAIVAGYPLDEPFTAVAARVGGMENARSPDIYHSTQVTRQIYAIRAKIKPGNSGGPLLAPDGQVYGVVFAAAVSVPQTGYALTGDEVASDARAGATATGPVSTGLCD